MLNSGEPVILMFGRTLPLFWIDTPSNFRNMLVSHQSHGPFNMKRPSNALCTWMGQKNEYLG